MKKLIRLMLIVVATFTLSGTSFAAPETYVIDNAHSFPRFSYSRFGYSTQLSHFDKTSGKIVFDKEARTGYVEVLIDMKSSLDTGHSVFNEHIQGEGLLNTENIRPRRSNRPR